MVSTRNKIILFLLLCVSSISGLHAITTDFNFTAIIKQNSFTREQDDAAQSRGLVSRFSELVVGSQLYFRASIDLGNVSLSPAGSGYFIGFDNRWEASDENGYLADSFGHVHIVEKTERVLSVAYLAYESYYDFNFRFDLSTGNGSLGISGQQPYDWLPFLQSEIVNAKIDGQPVPDNLSFTSILLLFVLPLAYRCVWARRQSAT